MGKLIKQYLLLIVQLILQNIDDILIIGGCSIIVAAFFIYISIFTGMIALSVILILFGLVLSKINIKVR